MPAVKDIDVRARKRAARKTIPQPIKPRRAAEPRLPPRWLKPLTYAGVLAFAGAIAVGGYTLWRSDFGSRVGEGLAGLAAGWSRMFGYTVQDVTIEGRRLVARDSVLNALGVHRGDSLLAFDPRAARERLEAIEWVEQAVVERRLPDTIHVRLKERSAVALWQREKDFVLIDRQGRVVRTVDPNYYGYLPLIAGAGAPEQITALFLLLVEAPDVGKRVRAAVWVGGRRWNLTLDNGVEVLLPEEDSAAALKRLAELDRAQRLLARDITHVDLRLPDRLVVRPSPQPESSAAPSARGNTPVRNGPRPGGGGTT